MHDYPTKMDAGRGILLEACRSLQSAHIDFVIAGGWVPYLRGGNLEFPHPGTHDVDILFDDEVAPMKTAVTELLSAGYVPSAKHPFQLLKKLRVGGKELVFNIDLMHPAESARDEDLFHDIVDLGIREDYDSHITHVIKSICFPSAKIVFAEHLWSPFDVTGVLPDGSQENRAIPLLDNAGLILSKCQSASKAKRARDSFDIYYVLSGVDGAATAQRLIYLAKTFPQIDEQLKHLREYLEKSPNIFNDRVRQFTGVSCNYAQLVSSRLFN
jgi:hypothetical protein